MQYFINDIADIVSGTLISSTTSAVAIEHLLIDSRKVVYPETSIFIAITGHRNNGHHYLQDAYDAGVRHFIIEHQPETPLPTDAHLVQVENSLLALQHIYCLTNHRQS